MQIHFKVLAGKLQFLMSRVLQLILLIADLSGHFLLLLSHGLLCYVEFEMQLDMVGMT